MSLKITPNNAFIYVFYVPSFNGAFVYCALMVGCLCRKEIPMFLMVLQSKSHCMGRTVGGDQQLEI